MSSSVPLAAPSPSDADLVVDVLGGARARFEGLMRRHNQRVFRVVRSFAASDADAEDQAQEVWLLAYRHLAQWEGRAGFGAWISDGALPQAPRADSQRTKDFVTVADVAGFVVATMPPDAPGSLPEGDYWAVLAFDLHANGIDLEAPLTPEVAQGLKIPR